MNVRRDEVCSMTIGTRAIWGAKLSRSPLYDISVSWINLKKTLH